jgi:hypothetical protein
MVFTARRPGTRVSPRNSARKSLTDTITKVAGNKRLSVSKQKLEVQGGRSKNESRSQSGRKTTSTFLRDIDDLVSQEAVPALPKSERKAPASARGMPAKGEQRGGSGRVDKRPMRRA